MDRIDLRVSVPRLTADELVQASTGETTETIRQRVIRARQKALERQKTANAYLQGRALREHIHLMTSSEQFAKTMATQLGLSARGFDRLLRVARTVADLANDKTVTETHLAEAVSYRGML
jgi:magnesium chelatase family protein